MATASISAALNGMYDEPGHHDVLLRLDILDAETTAQLKGTDLLVDDTAEFLRR